MNNLFSYLLYVYFADAAVKLVKVAVKLDERGSQHVGALLYDLMEDRAFEYLTALLPQHLSGGVVIAVDELADVVVIDKEKAEPAPKWVPDKSISDFDTRHLTDEQQKVARAIITAAKAEYAGGCRAFYTPQEWQARGEEYGCDSVLVVVHDGGDLAAAFNPAYEDDKTEEAVCKALKAAGYWAEACTCWYTAIYPSITSEKIE